MSFVYFCFITIFVLQYAIYYTMSIGEQIKKRRAVLHITQQNLADFSGISLRTIIALEDDSGNPSLSTLSKIADVLGLEVQLALKTDS